MQTRLRLTRVSPLSVLKLSVLGAVVLFVVLFVALGGLYLALDAFGVVSRVQDLVSSVTAAPSGKGANPLAFLDPSWVLPRLALVLGGLSVITVPVSVIVTLLGNLVLRVIGGVELTLRQSL